MANTSYEDVIDTFESSFIDKYELPDELVKVWFNKAVGDYSLEIEDLNYDKLTEEFDVELDQSVISTLASLMKKYYQEREYSRVNKINNIIGKDISLNNTDSTKKNTREELNYIKDSVDEYYNKQKTTVFTE